MHLTLLKSSDRSEILIALPFRAGKYKNDQNGILAGFSTRSRKS